MHITPAVSFLFLEEKWLKLINYLYFIKKIHYFSKLPYLKLYYMEYMI